MGTISSTLKSDLQGGHNRNFRKNTMVFSELQPKNNYLRSSSKKAEFVSNVLEMIRYGEKQNGCSSEKERKVNALALRAEEGRDYLR